MEGLILALMNKNEKEINRELFNAMEMIVLTNQGPTKQMNSFGCSIKWKNNE